ncbi:MAG: hypothetical protein M1814_000284 [Vezdaea aestivalis]|nr:MAG: hypothetical protein M1814_000284 [Vezdaea aestivalis]
MIRLILILYLCIRLTKSAPTGPNTKYGVPPTPIVTSQNGTDFITQKKESTTRGLRVGIIGAGAAGLYSALLLDSLGIEYEIIEGDSKAGGRILTHYFDEERWSKARKNQSDYYNYVELGAMRIPNIQYMARLIGNYSSSLVNYLNDHIGDDDHLELIPYIYRNDAAFYYYNGVRKHLDDPLTSNAFGILTANGTSGGISAEFASKDPFSFTEEITSNFTAAMSSNLSTGFAELAEYDGKSTRQFFSTAKGLSPAEIDWLETINDATGHYDLGLPQMIFDEWLFDSVSTPWLTIDGGMSRLTKALMAVIKQPVQFNRIVVSISQPNDKINVKTSDGNISEFDHVISTVPLGALQMIDTSDLDIPFEQVSAIRTVNYDAAVKVGMQFKTRWWEHLPRPILGGESFTDLSIRMIVYPSYGFAVKDPPGVVIASYTWAQDAHRICSFTSAENIPALTALILHSLSQIHNVSLSMLNEQHISTYPYSWYGSPLSMGAFAAYGPDQFARLLPILAKPAGKNGRLHFAGEGLSAGHQWIIGALDSGLRSVNELVAGEGMMETQKKLAELWGESGDFFDQNASPDRTSVIETW